MQRIVIGLGSIYKPWGKCLIWLAMRQSWVKRRELDTLSYNFRVWPRLVADFRKIVNGVRSTKIWIGFKQVRVLNPGFSKTLRRRYFCTWMYLRRLH